MNQKEINKLGYELRKHATNNFIVSLSQKYTTYPHLSVIRDSAGRILRSSPHLVEQSAPIGISTSWHGMVFSSLIVLVLIVFVVKLISFEQHFQSTISHRRLCQDCTEVGEAV